MPLPILPLLFLLFPILEIFGFIYVGQWLGAFRTVGLVLLSIVLGLLVLRVGGLSGVRRIRQSLNRGKTGGAEIADSLFIAIAGILLIIPGFISDFVGLCLLLPPVRALLRRSIRRHVKVSASYSARGFRQPRRSGPDDVIDLTEEDYQRTSEPTGPDRQLRDDGEPRDPRGL